MAAVDLALALALVALLCIWLKWYPALATLFVLFLGVAVHRLFCVNTTLNKLIFGIL